MKNTIDIVMFLVVWVLAITLIEYQGDIWLLDVAGNLFGAVALMLLGRFFNH